MQLLVLASLAFAFAHSLPEVALSRKSELNNGATFRTVHERMQKRTIDTNVFDVMTWGGGEVYCLNITVGSPPQPQTVLLATATSDIYLDSVDADMCQLGSSSSSGACRGGFFDSSASSTYQEIAASPAFNITYGDNSTAAGPLGADVVGIGDASISGIGFGVAESIVSTAGNSIGVMGLGYVSNEAVAESDRYPTILDAMVHSGAIDSRLFSVHLGSTSDTSGSLLFGGIDPSKYTGPLTALNILPSMDDNGQLASTLTYPIVAITDAVAIIDGQNYDLWSEGAADVEAYNQNNSLPVILDTGSTVWNIPNAAFDGIIQPAFAFAQVDWTNNSCSCEHANAGHVLNLTFGGKITIQFDASQFIVPRIDLTTNAPYLFKDNVHDECVLLIVPGDSDLFTFGLAFLRNMYVVYDLENGQVAIAQALLGDTGPQSIIPVLSGTAGLASAAPLISTAPSNTYSIPPLFTGTLRNAISTLATPLGTATGTAAVPVAAQASISSLAQPPVDFVATPRPESSSFKASTSPTSTPTPGPNPQPSNTGAIAGGVVGGVAGLAIIGGLVWFLARKRRQSRLSRAIPPSYETQVSSPEMHRQQLAI